MTHRLSLAHPADTHEHPPNVDVKPILSFEERQFLAGNMGANEYLDSGLKEAERWVRVESNSGSHGSTRRLLHLFAAFAAALYMAVAIGFLVVDARAAALASAIVSSAFMVIITLYRALRGGV